MHVYGADPGHGASTTVLFWLPSAPSIELATSYMCLWLHVTGALCKWYLFLSHANRPMAHNATLSAQGEVISVPQKTVIGDVFCALGWS